MTEGTDEPGDSAAEPPPETDAVTVPPPPVPPEPDPPEPVPPEPVPPEPVPPEPVPPAESPVRRSLLPIVLAAAAVVVVVAVVVVLLVNRGGSSAGTGKRTGQVSKGKVITRKVTLKKDQVLLLSATPKDKALNVALGAAVDKTSTGARSIKDFFSVNLEDQGSSASTAFSDAGALPEGLITAEDQNGPGVAEFEILPAPSDVVLTVVVGSPSGTSGSVEVDVQIADVKLPAKADTVLDALCANVNVKAFVQSFVPTACSSSSSPSPATTEQPASGALTPATPAPTPTSS